MRGLCATLSLDLSFYHELTSLFTTVVKGGTRTLLVVRNF